MSKGIFEMIIPNRPAEGDLDKRSLLPDTIPIKRLGGSFPPYCRPMISPVFEGSTSFEQIIA
jgi:hypothetical protein